MDVDRPEYPRELTGNPQRLLIRERLEAIVIRAEKATSWRDATDRLEGMVNGDGYVPVRARLTVDDLEFIAEAREELIGFATLGLRLLDLHTPRDAGAITSDTANPIQRCRCCMWRWPCPTFRAMHEALTPA